MTLVEILIVMALVSMVSLALYASLSSGLHIWQRVNTGVLEEDLNIFLEKFTQDIRSAFNFNGIAFSGGADRVEFATVVFSPRMNKASVGKVTYSYDAANYSVEREQRDYSENYAGSTGTARHSAKNVRFLGFWYYVYDGEKKEYSWLEECQGLPLAVRMELGVRDGSQTLNFTRTADIMAAGSP